MQYPFHTDYKRNSIVCVDSYEEGVLQGRLYSPLLEMETFSSLSQLLMKMEHQLNQKQIPQAYTQVIPEEQTLWKSMSARRGDRATFELQILFRQHTSWQGVIHWMGENVQQQFRSVLELIILLDNALNKQKTMLYSGVPSGKQERPPMV